MCDVWPAGLPLAHCPSLKNTNIVLQDTYPVRSIYPSRARFKINFSAKIINSASTSSSRVTSYSEIMGLMAYSSN